MRGWVFLLEAILASILLLGFLAGLLGWIQPRTEESPNAQAVLIQAFKRGLRDPEEIQEFAEGAGMNVKVCIDCQPPEAEEVWAGSYFTAEGKEVKIFLWR